MNRKPPVERYLEEQTAPWRQTAEWHNWATAQARWPQGERVRKMEGWTNEWSALEGRRRCCLACPQWTYFDVNLLLFYPSGGLQGNRWTIITCALIRHQQPPLISDSNLAPAPAASGADPFCASTCLLAPSLVWIRQSQGLFHCLAACASGSLLDAQISASQSPLGD